MQLNRLLSAYVQALWGQEIALLPPVPGQGSSPCLTQLGIHLPRQPAARIFQYAAVAHASAHRCFPRPRLPWMGRTGITRTLINLLEDARVEALALRELPGLLRLWLPFHAEIAAAGADFPSLLARLARALLDANYHDEHAWIRKGRQLFATAGGADAAPAELDRIASLLGHDIGQLRLQFNHREYLIQPGYRDDQRWLWEPESNTETALEMGSATDSGAAAAAAFSAGQSTVLPPLLTRHPEWDHRIRRLRPQWCLVRSWSPPAAAGPAAAPPQAAPALIRGFRARTPCRLERTGHDHSGDDFDTNRLLAAAVALRLRATPDDRLQLRRRWQRPPLVLLLLLDASASTRHPVRPGAATRLELAGLTAKELALAGEVAGCAIAVHAFRSAGREAVDYLLLRQPEEPWSALIDGRLHGLASAGSTRLGAALRHATAWLERRREGDRRLVVLTDGQPHDLDSHDPHYLTADARHAVQRARLAGLRVDAIGLDPDGSGGMRRIFGLAHCTQLEQASQLAACLRAILAT